MVELAEHRAGLELGERPEWHADAACRGIGPDVMFPVDALGVIDAQTHCDRCLVRQPCADVGLLEPFGVWGGASERTRQRLRKLAGLTVPRRPDRIDDLDDQPAPDAEDQ